MTATTRYTRRTTARQRRDFGHLLVALFVLWVIGTVIVTMILFH